MQFRATRKNRSEAAFAKVGDGAGKEACLDHAPAGLTRRPTAPGLVPLGECMMQIAQYDPSALGKQPVNQVTQTLGQCVKPCLGNVCNRPAEELYQGNEHKSGKAQWKVV